LYLLFLLLGFLDALKDLLGDSNPMVVANAVAALSELNEVSGKEILKVDSGNLAKMLAAINECTESVFFFFFSFFLFFFFSFFLFSC